MDELSGYRNKQAVQVLNQVEYDENGNPIGLKEDRTNPASANFGTERKPLKGGCYRGDGSAYIKVIANNGDIETVTALDENGDIIYLNFVYDTDHYQISGDSGQIAWNIKLWKSGITPTNEEIKAYTLQGSGGVNNLFAWYKASEGSGNTVYDCLGNNNGEWINAITDNSDPNSVHSKFQNIYSFFNEEGGTISDGVSYYVDPEATQLIPEGVIIPKISN